MKRGHVTGHKRERKPRQATLDRYKAIGEAIQKQLEGKTIEQLLNWPLK